jgi:hypothetical protein
MPKELIHSATRNGNADSSRIQVGWSKEAEYVQVVTNDGGSENAGQFVTLDRDGINKAIRMLRRARDQAFGRDE